MIDQSLTHPTVASIPMGEDACERTVHSLYQRRSQEIPLRHSPVFFTLIGPLESGPYGRRPVPGQDEGGKRAAGQLSDAPNEVTLPPGPVVSPGCSIVPAVGSPD